MIQAFLAIKTWDNNTIGKFYGYLGKLSDEDKCASTVFVAQALQKRGGKENLDAAEAILLYAADNHTAGATLETRARLHWALGDIYEKSMLDYEHAVRQYKLWRDLNSPVSGANIALARAVMLRDNFEYTKELEEYLLAGFGEGDLASRTDRLYEAIGNYIVSSFYGSAGLCKTYRSQAQSIVKADDGFLADFALHIQGFDDKLDVPQKTRIYIKQMD